MRVARRSSMTTYARSGRALRPGATQGKAPLQRARQYGIFVVDVGELEGWLASLKLNKSRGKGGWIVKAFEKLGSSPSAQGYVPPGKTDVWAFMGGCGRLD
jgi:hypothetical protein